MATAFNPEEVERGWYAWWAAHDYFEADAKPSGDRYSMVRCCTAKAETGHSS